MDRRLALVRPPSPRLAEGIVTHIDRSEVDLELARRQWEGYIEALNRHGWETWEVPEAPDCPDSVFVEDTMVVYGFTAVIANPASTERTAEVEAAAATVVGAGYRTVHITGPATLEGGDVLKFGGTVWVGLGGRTNEAGLHQLREHLAPLGAHIVGVPLTKALHLKSAVTALPDGTIIGYAPLVDDATMWPMFEAVPEESGAHVLILNPRTVLMASSAPETAARFRERGLQVEQVDISEFEKLEGSVTCLSVRLRG